MYISITFYIINRKGQSSVKLPLARPNAQPQLRTYPLSIYIYPHTKAVNFGEFSQSLAEHSLFTLCSCWSYIQREIRRRTNIVNKFLSFYFFRRDKFLYSLIIQIYIRDCELLWAYEKFFKKKCVGLSAESDEVTKCESEEKRSVRIWRLQFRGKRFESVWAYIYNSLIINEVYF